MGRSIRLRLFSPLVCLALVALLGGAPLAIAGSPQAEHGRRLASRAASVACDVPQWVGAWTADKALSSNQPSFGDRTHPFFNDQTLRMIVSPHYAGTSLRLRFTNRFGSSPVTFDDVRVGLEQGNGADVVAGSSRPVIFAGSGSVTIPAGSLIGSDPVRFSVTPFRHLAISFHVVGGPVALDTHPEPDQTSFLTSSGSGAHSDDASGAAFSDTTSSEYVVDELDVLASGPVDTVATLGDSITDGTQSTPGADARWPDDLQRRMLAAHLRMTVLNAGIGGNMISADFPLAGPSGASRFQYDVGSRPAVSDVIVLEGINDIGFYDAPAQQIEDALTNVAEQAHQAGYHISVATLTPYKGFPYWTPQGEQTREQVNAWIRHQHVFDHVIDFERVLEDPADPQQMNPKYKTDGVHPNDAGYRAMADAIDLSILHPATCRPAGSHRTGRKRSRRKPKVRPSGRHRARRSHGAGDGDDSRAGEEHGA